MSISFFRCLNKMCFLQIQGVQVCGIKRVIIQTTDFLQIKAYTVKKVNVFSFALWGLICYIVFIFNNLFTDISPQKVNSYKCCKIRGLNQVLTIAIPGCCQSSHLLGWCLAFDKDCWTWRQSENKNITKINYFNLITKHCAFMRIYLLSYPISWIKTQSYSCWQV